MLNNKKMGCSSSDPIPIVPEVKSEKEEEVHNKYYLKIYEICKSICWIVIHDNIITGFLIVLFRGKKSFLCLICNDYEMMKKRIESNKTIKIYYDNQNKNTEIKLNKNERYIKGYKNLDITVIEILPEDNIEEIYFLFPSLDHLNDYKINKLLNENIYIPLYPKKGYYGYYYGEITQINDYKFTYYGCTNYRASKYINSNSSGMPIFLDNTTDVIGIHKQDENGKSGIFIFIIIKYIQENLSQGKKMYGKNIYDGDFFNGKKDGKGKMKYENGEYYIGQWSKDRRHGKGKLYNKIGKIKYEGDFYNDKMEGKGKYYYENADYYYVGNWLNDKEHGRGALYYKNGDLKYVGEFAFGKFEGRGKLIYDSGEYYIGNWFNGEKNDKGIEYYKNGKIKYEGNFVNGKFEGKGKFIYENGEYYIGQFLNDLKHGKGILYNKNNTIKYEGDFVNDQMVK